VEDSSDSVGLQPEGESREPPGNNDCDVWLVDATVLDKARVRSITQFYSFGFLLVTVEDQCKKCGFTSTQSEFESVDVDVVLGYFVPGAAHLTKFWKQRTGGIREPLADEVTEQKRPTRV